MMKGSSQKARDAVLKSFEPVANAAGEQGLTLASELFAVVDALDGSGSLRRALTDPARDGADKAALVASLFAQFDARVVAVVADFARARWSSEADIATSVEDAGVLALLASAEAKGTLQTVEEQLFRFERELVGHPDLLAAVGDRTLPASARVGVVHDVLAGKADPVTIALLERVVGTPRGARVLTLVRRLVQAAADRRERLVARVTAAVELSASQRERLTAILTKAYGHEIQLNVAVEPQVLGGIKVQVGSEVVDGTVVARLADARRRLVG